MFNFIDINQNKRIDYDRTHTRVNDVSPRGPRCKPDNTGEKKGGVLIFFDKLTDCKVSNCTNS